ncbi:hypothetical protein CJD36_020170 [Flavipsychrobacter stenotrophus]|uniref:Uncharacterized protein n=1 Tax=Flavipsychrobacter stenotrophus TaxID=2077091 RepID=A0A2S7SRE1_9BACT|nr:hypothetical protein [Flavipsychrobacter stenotrophus]PQJ09116.1 hypothetical protein CJD36_020170 [Flavipsychrobacter stenotrophus]
MENILIDNDKFSNFKLLENKEALLKELYDDTVVYAIDFQFKFQSMDRSVVMQFTTSVDGPRREEVILLKFNDFGEMRRISAFIDHIYHQFFPKGTIQNINHDAYLMTIFLKGVTEQPL